MRKIKLIPSVAIIALFVSILSSCGESESARKQGEKARQIERQKQIADSTTKADADSVKARAERPYDFVPEIVMATKEVEKMDLCGESQYKCQTYSADIYFYIDSTNESSKHRLRLSYNVSVDTKENYKEEMKVLADMKKAYSKIINTEAKNLIVTYNPKTNRMVIRENLPLQQRKTVGKALLMEEVDDLIWQDSY